MTRASLAGLVFSVALLMVLASTAAQDMPTTLVFPTFEHTWGIRKATSRHLFLFVGLRTRFNDPQGLAAVRLVAWEDTTTQDDDDELVVYGVNSGEDNLIYNTSMYSVGVYGQKGSGPGQLNHPQGIAADPQGNVYIADSGNDRIVWLFNTGRELLWKGSWGSRGDGLGQFRSPSGVALDSQGQLYVTDTGNDRIQVFGPEGRFLRELEADLCRPQGIAVIDSEDRWSYYHQTYICVADSGGGRLVKVSPHGQLLAWADHRQAGLVGGRFAYLAIDYYGNVWATDPDRHCLHKFDRNLHHVVSFGQEGDGDGEFISPRGLAIWRRFGQVFVAEKTGAQYYWVGVDLLDVEVSSAIDRQGFLIRLVLTERAFLTIEIEDGQKRIIGALVAGRRESIGAHQYWWDGQRPGGGPLPSGNYTVRIMAEPTYSSYHYFQKVVEKRVRL